MRVRVECNIVVHTGKFFVRYLEYSGSGTVRCKIFLIFQLIALYFNPLHAHLLQYLSHMDSSANHFPEGGQ